MNYPTYITHELIMETTKVYKPRNFKKCEKDFEKIKSFRRSALGKFVIVEGTIHLYGYRIAGDSPYCGFYDVINHNFYTKENIEKATITEYKNECIYESPAKARRLKK